MTTPDTPDTPHTQQTPDKTCAKCGCTFPATPAHFPPHACTRDGLEGRCRNCKRAYLSDWQKRNRPSINARRQASKPVKPLLPVNAPVSASAQSAVPASVKVLSRRCPECRRPLVRFEARADSPAETWTAFELRVLCGSPTCLKNHIAGMVYAERHKARLKAQEAARVQAEKQAEAERVLWNMQERAASDKALHQSRREVEDRRMVGVITNPKNNKKVGTWEGQAAK